MKRFLSVALSLVLVLCISILATGCATKVKGKTFSLVSTEYEVSTKGMTNLEKSGLILMLKTKGVTGIDENTSDKDLAKKINEALVDSSQKEGKITFTDTEVKMDSESEPTFYYTQKGSSITLFNDKEMKNESGAYAEAKNGKVKLYINLLELMGLEGKGVTMIYTLK